MPEQKDNSFVLFKNKNKKTDKHPEYTGPAMFHGEEGYVAVWVNKAQSGQLYMSGKFTPKDDPEPSQASQQPEPVEPDDLPF